MASTLPVCIGSSPAQNISQMASTFPISIGSGPTQNLSQMASTLPISPGFGHAQNLSQMASTRPISTGTISDLSHDSGSNKSNMLKMFERKFKRIKTESFELEKSAQDAISFWHSQCHGSVIITGAIGFLSIAKLPCYTVEIFGGLLLLFLLGMIYPSICAFHKLSYVDASLERLKKRLANLRERIIDSSVAVPEEHQELQSFADEIRDFKLLVKSRHSVDLIVQIICAVAYFLTMLFIAYEVFCGDVQNPHEQNLIEQVWDQSQDARKST